MLSLVIALAAVPMLLLRLAESGARTAAATSPSPGATSVPTVPVAQAVSPVLVECSSERVESPCDALTDGNTSTAWATSGPGDGVRVTFFFSPPVVVSDVTITNLSEQVSFSRHQRIRSFELRLADTPQAVIGSLEDQPGSQQISVDSRTPSSSVTLTIESVYPGKHTSSLEPFDEMAIGEIAFTAPQPSQ